MVKALSTLIVDDHVGMRTTLQDILEDEGYHVSSASSGDEAIELCQEHKFDIILMDVRMPGINGVEAFKKIKTISKDSRVIMMSAYSIDEMKLEALKEGAIAFLEKPLDISQVLKLIAEDENTPVLLVMQDTKELEKIVNILEDKTYRTHATHSPDEAMELARQIRFKLIIIETRLDPISGLELFFVLKQIVPDTVTIILADTEDVFINQAKEAVKNNAYTFLKKPLEMNTFISILDRLKKQLNSDIIQKPGLQD